jgi:hypothetical protein
MSAHRRSLVGREGASIPARTRAPHTAQRKRPVRRYCEYIGRAPPFGGPAGRPKPCRI